MTERTKQTLMHFWQEIFHVWILIFKHEYKPIRACERVSLFYKSLSPAITVEYVTAFLTKWVVEEVDCCCRFYNCNRCYCFDAATWTLVLYSVSLEYKRMPYVMKISMKANPMLRKALARRRNLNRWRRKSLKKPGRIDSWWQHSINGILRS